MYVSRGKKCSFFGKYGELCFLETPVLTFTLLVYYRWNTSGKWTWPSLDFASMNVIIYHSNIKNFRSINGIHFLTKTKLTERWLKLLFLLLTTLSFPDHVEELFTVTYFISQKQPFRGVLWKRCPEDMPQIYRTPMPKCDFNKVASFLRTPLQGCFWFFHSERRLEGQTENKINVSKILRESKYSFLIFHAEAATGGVLCKKLLGLQLY